MPEVSLPATLVATVLGCALGALWYGPLFGKPWLAAVGRSRDDIQRDVNPATAYGLTFVLGLVAAYAFGWFIGPQPGRAFAVFAGAMAGLCWVTTALATNYLFEGRRASLVLINGGYHVVRFMLIGLSFGVVG